MKTNIKKLNTCAKCEKLPQSGYIYAIDSSLINKINANNSEI